MWFVVQFSSHSDFAFHSVDRQTRRLSKHRDIVTMALNEKQEFALAEEMRRNQRSIQSAKMHLDQILSLFLATAQVKYDHHGCMRQVEQILQNTTRQTQELHAKMNERPERNEQIERARSRSPLKVEQLKHEQPNELSVRRSPVL